MLQQKQNSMHGGDVEVRFLYSTKFVKSKAIGSLLRHFISFIFLGGEAGNWCYQSDNGLSKVVGTVFCNDHWVRGGGDFLIAPTLLSRIVWEHGLWSSNVRRLTILARPAYFQAPFFQNHSSRVSLYLLVVGSILFVYSGLICSFKDGNIWRRCGNSFRVKVTDTYHDPSGDLAVKRHLELRITFFRYPQSIRDVPDQQVPVAARTVTWLWRTVLVPSVLRPGTRLVWTEQR